MESLFDATEGGESREERGADGINIGRVAWGKIAEESADAGSENGAAFRVTPRYGRDALSVRSNHLRRRRTDETLQVVSYQVLELPSSGESPDDAQVAYRTLADKEVGYAHVVPNGPRELDEHIGIATCVDDVEGVAEASEEALGAPTFQGATTRVEYYLPLIHVISFLVYPLCVERIAQG